MIIAYYFTFHKLEHARNFLVGNVKVVEKNIGSRPVSNITAMFDEHLLTPNIYFRYLI